MKEPVLMANQGSPFNGDTFIEQEFISLRDRFGIKTAVETGTCLGHTTLFLAKHFEKVYTVEINKEFLELARPKFIQHPNITSIGGNSPDVISGLSLDDKTLFFLDAHWQKSCPLIDELKEIAIKKIKPVIAIHDFFVPGEPLGFDTWNGQAFKLEWLKPYIDAIYPEGFMYYYNSDKESAGAKRGIIYLHAI